MASRKRGARAERRPESAAGGFVRHAPWLVALATFAVYLPALGNGFVNWDDDRNFLENPFFRGLGPDHLEWAFSTFLLGHYHPLTWLSLELDYVIWGLEPFGFHLTSALLHAAVAAVVYGLFVELIRRAREHETATTTDRAAAAVGALLFALHPLRVESVAWASERRDVLCGLFYALTALLYVRGMKLASLGCFVLALGSKVLAATLPVALVALDIYPLRRGLTVKTVLEKAPYFTLALAAGLVGVGRYDAGLSGAAADLDLYPDVRAALTVYGPAFYLWKTLAPFELYPQYVYSLDPGWGDARIWLAAALAVGVTAWTAVRWRAGKPAPAMVWGVYLVTLAPVLSLLRLDRQQAVNDHHSYLATLGFAALAAGAWAEWRERRPRPATMTAVAVLVALAGLTVRQIGFWRDSETLWAHTVAGQPLSLIARNNLGRALEARGDLTGALHHFRQAVEIDPGYAHAQYNLGVLQMRQGDLAAAEQRLRAAVEREPRFARAWSDLGNCLLRQRRVDEAVAAYGQALEIEPTFADAWFNLALAYEASGRVNKAAAAYNRVILISPDAAVASDARARLSKLVQRGK